MIRGLYALLAAALLISITACSHHSPAPDNNCISRYPSSGAVQFLPASTLDSINTLFVNNNLPLSGLQFISVSRYTTVSPGYNGSQIQIGANLYINDLPVTGSAGQEYFTFDSTGNYMAASSVVYSGAIPNKDTSSHQNLQILRQTFLRLYKQCTFTPGTLNGKPYHPTAAYQDTCLDAELGYSDAAVLNTGIAPGTELIKMWTVSATSDYAFPEHGGFPSVYVADASGFSWPEQIFAP